jgi:hypothetical protein
MSIWFCEMEVNCPKQWGELQSTDSPLVMNCDECGKSVHWMPFNMRTTFLKSPPLIA